MEMASFKLLLLKLLQEAYTVQEAWFSCLRKEEQLAVGTAEYWSAKDHIAYLAFWQRRLNAQLATELQERQPYRWPEIEETDLQLFYKQQYRPVKDILQEAAEAHRQLTSLVHALSEEDLGSRCYDWVDAGDSLGTTIMAWGYAHPLEHIAQYYLDRDNLEQATHIREALVEQMLQASMPDTAKGIELYNLACFYATHNILNKVLNKLLQALRFCPHLKEWALNDPDLVVVRHQLR